MIEIIEPEVINDTELDTSGIGMPPIFGKCPVCGKPLFPRDRYTGQMKAPPVGTGYDSRAKCGGCGAVICYTGNGEWRVLTDSDLDESELSE